ncbi:hypothetical protein D3C72_2092140 [compost metagenome]
MQEIGIFTRYNFNLNLKPHRSGNIHYKADSLRVGFIRWISGILAGHTAGRLFSRLGFILLRQ